MTPGLGEHGELAHQGGICGAGCVEPLRGVPAAGRGCGIVTHAADKRPRVWPLRLVQASPLIVFVLGLAVWFGVPAAARYVATERVAQDNTNAFEDMPPELAVLTVLRRRAANERQHRGVCPHRHDV